MKNGLATLPLVTYASLSENYVENLWFYLLAIYWKKSSTVSDVPAEPGVASLKQCTGVFILFQDSLLDVFHFFKSENVHLLNSIKSMNIELAFYYQLGDAMNLDLSLKKF